MSSRLPGQTKLKVTTAHAGNEEELMALHRTFQDLRHVRQCISLAFFALECHSCALFQQTSELIARVLHDYQVVPILSIYTPR